MDRYRSGSPIRRIAGRKRSEVPSRIADHLIGDRNTGMWRFKITEGLRSIDRFQYQRTMVLSSDSVALE
jgi:hypothetical protein